VEEEEDFEADFEVFEVESGESELESEDEAKPFAAPRSGVARGIQLGPSPIWPFG
jgi:EREBP-like factor